MSAQSTQTTLYRMLDGADPAPVFSFEGNWYGASRLR